MSVFYTNKHPIFSGNNEDGSPKFIPEGTAFTIVSIQNMGYDLKIVDKEKRDEFGQAFLCFMPEMLNAAFTANDYI